MNSDQKQYVAQSAKDAQAAGYGQQSYWDYLEEHARELAAKGVKDAMTQSLSDALRGNDGD